MSLMLSELHSALIAAGVAQFRDDINDLKSTLRLHTWILSANSAGLAILIGLAIRH